MQLPWRAAYARERRGGCRLAHDFSVRHGAAEYGVVVLSGTTGNLREAGSFCSCDKLDGYVPHCIASGVWHWPVNTIQKIEYIISMLRN